MNDIQATTQLAEGYGHGCRFIAPTSYEWLRVMELDGGSRRLGISENTIQSIAGTVLSAITRHPGLLDVRLARSKAPYNSLMDVDLSTGVLVVNPYTLTAFLAERNSVAQREFVMASLLDCEVRISVLLEISRLDPKLAKDWAKLLNLLPKEILAASSEVYFGEVDASHSHSWRATLEFIRQFWQHHCMGMHFEYAEPGKLTELFGENAPDEARQSAHDQLCHYFDSLEPGNAERNMEIFGIVWNARLAGNTRLRGLGLSWMQKGIRTPEQPLKLEQGEPLLADYDITLQQVKYAAEELSQIRKRDDVRLHRPFFRFVWFVCSVLICLKCAERVHAQFGWPSALGHQLLAAFPFFMMSGSLAIIPVCLTLGLLRGLEHIWPSRMMRHDEKRLSHLGPIETQFAQYNKDTEVWRTNRERAKRSYWLDLSGWDFEKEVAKILQKKGYGVVVTQGSNDGGVDLILTSVDQIIVVQCKNHAKAVSPAYVRELYGTMVGMGASSAWMIASSGVSVAARRFADGKPIRIIDLEEVLAWEKETQKS